MIKNIKNLLINKKLYILNHLFQNFETKQRKIIYIESLPNI